MPAVQILSYVLGSLALTLLIVSAFLLAFIRVSTVVVVTPTITVTPTVSIPPLKEIQLQAVVPGTLRDIADWGKIVTPLVSVGSDVTSTQPIPTTPPFAPGVIPFTSTISKPLQIPPEGMGFCAISTDGQQFVSSFDNGYSAFAQYTITGGTSLDYTIYKTAYQQQHNVIYFNCLPTDPTGTQNPPSVNITASSVGSIGYASIAMSKDGYRLYVGYRSPQQGNSTSAALFPFLQLVGFVATYTLPVDPSSTGQIVSPDWIYNCGLGMHNPFGCQAAGLDYVCDPISHQILQGDDFGQIIRTTVNLQNSARVVAVRANFGFAKQNGALIAIFEEQNRTSQLLVGVVQLFDSYSKTPFSFDQKLSFGKDFAIGNDCLISSVRIPGTNCYGGAVTPSYQITYFQRNDTTRNWDFRQILNGPGKNQDFGVSVVVSNDGNIIIVGAPTLPNGSGATGTPGIGGSVYVYGRSTDKTLLALIQTVNDPFATSNTLGAFGYFLSVDPQFLILAISANQNNVLDQAPVALGHVPSSQYPQVVFVAINQSTSYVDTTKAQMVPQISNLATDYRDPLFGCNLAMAFEGNKPGGLLHVIFSSPLNETLRTDTMNATS